MQNNLSNSNGSCTCVARGFAPFFAMLSMGLASMASPADAAPFAYVANAGADNLSVIDTATNKLVATIPVGGEPVAVAVTPDGKHAYVANAGPFPPGTVSVLDTATNKVTATVTVGAFPFGVAVAPDGKHAYVTNNSSGTVSVIATATNTVVATVEVGAIPVGVAVSPDGKRAYVANAFNVSVIDTATNTVVATVPVGENLEGVAVAPNGKHVYVAADNFPGATDTVSVIDTATSTVVAPVEMSGFLIGVAVTPDGRHAYVTNNGDSATPGAVLVIDTATNTLVATISMGGAPYGVAITPDGKRAYVAGGEPNSVSVIDTATNKVVATATVGTVPAGVGIVPPPPGVPFLAFSAKLQIQFGSIPTKDAFGFGSNFILSNTAPAIDPLTDQVTLQVGTFTATIPPGSFKKQQDGSFTFQGKIDGVGLGAVIKRTGTQRYLFEAQARGANLTGTVKTVYATLAIGGGSFSNSNSGATSVTADIAH